MYIRWFDLCAPSTIGYWLRYRHRYRPVALSAGCHRQRRSNKTEQNRTEIRSAAKYTHTIVPCSDYIAYIAAEPRTRTKTDPIRKNKSNRARANGFIKCTSAYLFINACFGSWERGVRGNKVQVTDASSPPLPLPLPQSTSLLMC